MNRILSAMARVAPIIAAGSAASDGATDSARAAADRRAIDRGHEALLSAMRSNSLDSLLPLLTDGAVFAPPNEPPVSGKASIRAWEERLLTQIRTTAVAVSDRDVVVAGDWAIEPRRVSLYGVTRGGRESDPGSRQVHRHLASPTRRRLDGRPRYLEQFAPANGRYAPDVRPRLAHRM